MNETHRRHHGSCHCKRVRFAVTLDLAAGTIKCNCTWCWKQRRWGARVDRAAFDLLEGIEHLSEGDRGGFCRRCGIATHLIVDTTGWEAEAAGQQVSVNIAALDDLDVATLVAAPVAYLDGLNDDWWHPPAETRHL